MTTDKSFGYISEDGLIVTHLSEQEARKLAQDCANRTGQQVTLTGPIETLEPED
jgi:hypothetical protein